MNKRVFGRKLSRSRPAREALFATLARALILNGKIVTTRAKAKAVQTDVEKFITLAKKGTLAGRRRILSSLDNKRDAVDNLYQKITAAFSGRQSGYTRIISLPRRKGDNAEMARLEWTDKIVGSEKPKADNKKIKKAKVEKKTPADKKIKPAKKNNKK